MSYCDHRPRAYAFTKIDEMLVRWGDASGDAVRRYGPIIWPGVPPQALIALGANSTGATEAISTAGFWEIGRWNTPAGDPSQEPATGGAWYAIATGDYFRQLTNRRGVTGSGWSRALADQAIIGMIDYRNKINSINNRIPSDIQVPSPDQWADYRYTATQWAWACGAMGYVNSTPAVAAINAVASQLRAFREPYRFGALLGFTAQVGYTYESSYPLVRAWQRLEVGRLLAERTGGDTAWFDTHLQQFTDPVEHLITQARYGAPDCPTQPGAFNSPGVASVPAGGTDVLAKLTGAVLIVAGRVGASVRAMAAGYPGRRYSTGVR